MKCTPEKVMEALMTKKWCDEYNKCLYYYQSNIEDSWEFIRDRTCRTCKYKPKEKGK